MSTRGKGAALRRFTYHGPMSGVTLDDGSEVMLVPGKTVDLPPKNTWVIAAQARGHLVPDDGAAEAKSGKES